MRVEDLEGYIKQISNAELKNADSFCMILKNSELILGMSDSVLATELMVTRPTVNRWRTGKNAPHYFMREGIYKFLQKKAKALIKKLNKANQGGGGSSSGEPMVAKPY